MNRLKYRKARYDSFIIWGHGLQYANDIYNLILNNNKFEIIRSVQYKVRNINKFVSGVYSFDYAPLYHLKDKVRYLKNTPREVLIIFIKNNCPEEYYYGENKFRHLECKNIKDFKNDIRQKYNPKDSNGNITHEHVIHATDNESQTNSILKLIGYKDGISYLRPSASIFKLPLSIKEPDEFLIKEVSFENIICINLIEENNRIKHKKIPIHHSVQYKGIDNIEIYNEYLNRYRSKFLKDNYNIEKFKILIENFNYLDKGYENNYILVKNDMNSKDNSYIIVDGLHRAAIHMHQKNKKIKVCVI